ncbi:hypothetical protein LTR17_020679 [Elasticomyces elasticus]|nr:hypothetical protein LTR17_020679 [Elasticomyces elasticus]
MRPHAHASIVNAFRRASASTIHRRPSKVLDDNGEDDVPVLRVGRPGRPGGNPDATLLALPTEMLGQILHHVAYKDFCAMRTTCREAERRLTEGDILREWLHCNFDASFLILYPPPERVTFAYLSSMQKRYAVAADTAGLYTEYIERHIVRHSLIRLSPYLRDVKLKEDFREIAIIMQDRMLPMLLTLQHYLETCAKLYIDEGLCTTPRSWELSAAEQHYLKQERKKCRIEQELKTLESYEPDHLLDVYNLWLFMSWTHNQLIEPPSYEGNFSRALHWKDVPLSSGSLDFIIVFGNLNALGQLMRIRAYRERQKAVKEWLRVLDPATCHPWRKNWAHFSLEYGKIMSEEEGKRVIKIRPQDGEVFLNNARAVLIRQGLLHEEGSTEVGTTQQCTEFLCQIAGYDVLHILPSHRPAKIVDEDTEWCMVCEERHLASDCSAAYMPG